MSDGAAVTVAGLRMRYGPTDVLHGVDLRIPYGETVALLGPNGAGKTTTIEILEGFRARSAGEVAVLGTDPAHGDEHWRARVGVVLQSWRDHGKWRVRELLAHLASHYACLGRTPWDAGELADAVGLGDRGAQKIRTLSGGQRRRLDVAIGIVGRPDLLFLDEPTTGFDPEARRGFHRLVRDLGAAGTTVLVTTHDLHEAERLADRIVILDAGRVIADGTPAELARRIAGADRVRWRHRGRTRVHATDDSTAFVRGLFERHGAEIAELEVRRASLEQTYLALVHAAERTAEATAEGTVR
ncbi:ABC transporter ATP-binding protein [Streptomyces sp. WMMC500]|uniref:ABC transporter ATP-binding protein n=1 Tax=Streptomyces sp. WMMC500 TaxID=3015154 RepID=UPI00248B3884|nr:ABC transporter ATP-binding protein [Streptomyces sp. WMMC500]WBB61576.1 ABC transporter ATP-binding protein [Streptomyces sp. WMMC500]